MEGISYEQFTRAAEAEQQRFNLMTPLEYYDTLKNYTAQLAKGTKPRDLPKSGACFISKPPRQHTDLICATRIHRRRAT
mgnify:CR=1 FL=1